MRKNFKLNLVVVLVLVLKSKALFYLQLTRIDALATIIRIDPIRHLFKIMVHCPVNE